jgi:hypothetical protein
VQLWAGPWPQSISRGGRNIVIQPDPIPWTHHPLENPVQWHFKLRLHRLCRKTGIPLSRGEKSEHHLPWLPRHSSFALDYQSLTFLYVPLLGKRPMQTSLLPITSLSIWMANYWLGKNARLDSRSMPSNEKIARHPRSCDSSDSVSHSTLPPELAAAVPKSKMHGSQVSPPACEVG